MHGGILTALADLHLSKVLAALHREPERAWALEELAQIGGMSRARFAAHFPRIVGQTPFEYLTCWRIGVAQSMLKRGQPLKMVAPAVGYSSTGALTRVFSQIVGKPPTAWLAAQTQRDTDQASRTSPLLRVRRIGKLLVRRVNALSSPKATVREQGSVVLLLRPMVRFQRSL